MKSKEMRKKEEVAEDWCFTCKDGGLLLVCDYKQCLKSYHPDCVGKDDSFVDSGNRWICGLHSCYVCCRSSDFQCYCCPTSVCGRCIKASDFVKVRGKKGFCDECLKLVLLVEEEKDVDSDGEKVDFKDRETYEGLFREYWEIINKTESLTVEMLISADARLKKHKNYRSGSDMDDDSSGEENGASDFDDVVDLEAEKVVHNRKSSKEKVNDGVKSKKPDFTGWGSKSLIEFLKSIGKNTNEKISQREVCNIMNGYIKENMLLHPEKKNWVLCDAKLKSVLGRKKVNKHRMYDLLESHFAENQEESGEEEVGYHSEHGDDDIFQISKRQKKPGTNKITQRKDSGTNEKIQKEDLLVSSPQLYYASIVPENMKLVYLKRTLVQQLLQHPKTFETKVIGSFVRVKLDPCDCFGKKFYQLVQVKEVKNSADEENQEVTLQVCPMGKDISISQLSDDEFSEEECIDLKKKVKDGMLRKLTLDWFKQKAIILREDIMKHWIPRELSFLQNCIDQANEKGWRREYPFVKLLMRNKFHGWRAM